MTVQVLMPEHLHHASAASHWEDLDQFAGLDLDSVIVCPRREEWCEGSPQGEDYGKGFRHVDLPRSLRGRNDRSEKAGNRGQISPVLTCIALPAIPESRRRVDPASEGGSRRHAKHAVLHLARRR